MRNITFEQLPEAIGQLHEKLERLERLISAQTAPIHQEADQLLTIQEAANFLHLSVPTLYGKVHTKEVPFSKPGKRLYFSKAELTAWVQSGRQKTGTEISAETAKYINSKSRR